MICGHGSHEPKSLQELIRRREQLPTDLRDLGHINHLVFPNSDRPPNILDDLYRIHKVWIAERLCKKEHASHGHDREDIVLLFSRQEVDCSELDEVVCCVVLLIELLIDVDHIRETIAPKLSIGS